ncbi:MAG: hypothetical protein U0353_17320 [Sandaracinus sp.]
MVPRSNAHPRLVEVVSLVAALLVLTQGCDAPGRGACARCGDGGAWPADSSTVVDAGARSAPRLEITPAGGSIVVDGDDRPTLTLEARVLREGTVDEAATITFSASPSDIATIDANGLLRPTGRRGGTVRVTARVEALALESAVDVEITLARTSLLDATREDGASFGSEPAAASEGTRIAYPPRDAVMPSNVLAPEIMWEPVVAGELVRVEVSRPHARITTLARTDDARIQLPEDAWATLLRTDAEAPVRITIDRLAGGTVLGARPIEIRIARGALAGSAYYWSVANGAIVRIDDDRAERHSVVAHPAAVREGDGTSTRCVGCHTISPSGRWMAASMGSGSGPAGVRVGAVFDLTAELERDPAPSTFPTRSYEDSPTWTQASWSPREDRLVVERDMRLHLVDPFVGSEQRALGAGFVDAISVQPDWSPTGHQIAFVRASSWTVDYLAGDLVVVDVDGDTIGAERIVHRGATLSTAAEGGSADSYPTFSPDGRLLAFAHGTTPFAPSGTGALYAVGVEGGAAQRLERASAGGHAFAPRFAPFVSGGYAWLTFHSPRPYGNRVVEDPREAHEGIWVSAVRLDAAPGEDPSAAPYWLPGQDPATSNVSVSWARRACRVDGDTCSEASECCGGACEAGVCSPPDARLS